VYALFTKLLEIILCIHSSVSAYILHLNSMTLMCKTLNNVFHCAGDGVLLRSHSESDEKVNISSFMFCIYVHRIQHSRLLAISH